MEQKILDERVDKIRHQILKDWNLCGSPFKDIIPVIVRDFRVENGTKNEMDIVLKQLSEDIIGKICVGIESCLGSFGIGNLRVIMKAWIEESIGEELHRRVEQANDGRVQDNPVQLIPVNSNTTDGGLSYIQ